MECVLGDVSNTAVGMLPDVPLVRHKLSGQELNDGRLSGTIWSNTRHSARKGDSNRDTSHLRTMYAWIRELDAIHLHDSLALRCYAFQNSWLRELELDLGGLELKVGLCSRYLLHELREVSLVLLQLQGVNLDDVRAHSFKQTAVMRHNDTRHILEAEEIRLHPLDVHNIKMIGGLVKQQNVCLLEHSSCESKLHSPSTRQMRHTSFKHDICESD
mmetsp:Transcript_11389/g.34836  ORF Transcript_11389/g.34836 Transcript_11389/m.34836 type:complete len:215 (-) Transcript_11389:339-983(-)